MACHPRILAFLLPGLVFLSAWPSPAQQRPATAGPVRTFSLSGSLRYGDTGKSAENIRVDLRRFTGETISTAFTRSNGRFAFSGLTRGNYILVVEQEGFETIREEVEIQDIDRRGVFLSLRRPLKFTTRSASDSVSVRELGLPKKAREALEKGRQQLFQKKDSKKSIRYFRKAIDESPAYYEAYHLMGLAYGEMGNPKEAEMAYRKAIELSGDQFAEAQISLAGLYCNLKRFPEAEQAARRGLEIDSSLWRGHYHLAQAAFGMNHLPEAEENIRQAITLQPDFADSHLLYANIHIRRHDYPALLVELDEYLRLAPDGPFSASAREMRAAVQKQLAAAQKESPAPSSKP